MVKLRRLTIHRFRQVRPGTTLEFADGFNLVLGKNGTGKTTLLELLGACWALDFSAYKELEFHVELLFSSEHGTVGLELQNRRSIGSGSVRWNWSGRLAIRALLNGREHVGECRLPADARHVGSTKGLLTFPPFTPMPSHESGIRDLRRDLWDSVRWSPDQSPLEDSPPSVAAPVQAFPASKYRFDEALAWLDWGRRELVYYIDDTRSQLLGLLRYGRLGGAFQEAFSRKIGQNGTVLPDSLTITSKDTLLLQAIAGGLDIDSVELTVKRSHQDDHDVFGRLEVGMRRSDGAKFDSGDMSFGQQRMFAFLWYLACSPEVCIADELANGLHHDWIEAAMKAIGERQAFLATQHPFLIDFLPAFDDAEQVRRTFVFCVSELVDGGEVWTWKQLDLEEAEAIAEQLQVSFMHVNEVLQNRGLW